MKMNKITTRRAWTEQENMLIIEMYSTMLRNQVLGIKYSKAPIVREYAEKLERSRSSVECKAMNISAILQEKGLDTVKGYKALSNYNNALKTTKIGCLRQKNRVMMIDHQNPIKLMLCINNNPLLGCSSTLPNSMLLHIVKVIFFVEAVKVF